MIHSHKILLNSVALSVRILVATVVTLLSTRIALSALGADSFGLFNLIAGVVVLLSFLNGALMISTQRFLSIAIGEDNSNQLSDIFNVSLLIHLLFAIIVALLLKGVQPLLFDGFLDIPGNLVAEAYRVYDVMILSSSLTILSIPYSAMMNAREDMVFFAFSEILMLGFRLLAAVVLLYIDDNLLLVYTWLMLFSIVVGLGSKCFWCRIKYSEAKILVRNMKNKQLFREMLGFVGWNTMGSAAVLVRNQGVAIVLNVFFGTVINAAYGIANQVNSLVLSLSSTLTTVFTPSIIQSKGEGNYEKMLFVAVFASKMSFFLSSVISLPLVLYMPEVLDIWLKEVPPYTVEFCRLIVLSFVILQFYPGLNRAIYATGNIKWYQIAISIILTAIIPIGYWLFYLGFTPDSILVIMLMSQVLTLVATIYFAKKYVGLNVKEFIFRAVFLSVLSYLFCFILVFVVDKYLYSPVEWLGLLSYSCLTMLLYSVLYFYFVFKFKEREIILTLIKSLINKIL